MRLVKLLSLHIKFLLIVCGLPSRFVRSFPPQIKFPITSTSDISNNVLLSNNAVKYKFCKLISSLITFLIFLFSYLITNIILSFQYCSDYEYILLEIFLLDLQICKKTLQLF